MNWFTSPLLYLGAILFSGFALCGFALWAQSKQSKPGDFDQSTWFLVGLLCVAILSVLAFFFFTFFKPVVY
jgi:hypothetical protein